MENVSKRKYKKKLTLWASLSNRWIAAKLWSKKEERLDRLNRKAYNIYCNYQCHYIWNNV